MKYHVLSVLKYHHQQLMYQTGESYKQIALDYTL